MDRNYEQEYKKAFEAAKGLYDAGNALTKRQMETVFPQLAESEDEDTMRKELKRRIKWLTNELQAMKELIDSDAWLEKQKINTEGDFGRGYDCGYEACLNSHGAEWFEKQKEQKPAKYLDKDVVYAIMKKLHDLSFSQLIPINSEEYKRINEITSDVRSLLDYSIEQKPAEWSEEDERMRNQLIYDVEQNKKEGLISAKQNKATKALYNGIEKCYDEKINWLKFLPGRFNLQPKPEWSEEDEKMRQSIIKDIEFERNYTSATTGKVIGKYNEQIAWLKSLRPQSHWKPSEEQMKALLKAVDKARELHYTSIDGYDGYNDLRSLYEQLKKL